MRLWPLRPPLRHMGQQKELQRKTQEQPSPSRLKGLFIHASTALLTGEIVHHLYALQHGESYPVSVLIDPQNNIITFPDLHPLLSYIRNS